MVLSDRAIRAFESDVFARTQEVLSDVNLASGFVAARVLSIDLEADFPFTFLRIRFVSEAPKLTGRCEWRFKLWMEAEEAPDEAAAERLVQRGADSLCRHIWNEFQEGVAGGTFVVVDAGGDYAVVDERP